MRFKITPSMLGIAASLLGCLAPDPARAETLRVSNVEEWQQAMQTALPGDLVQLAPGKYALTSPLMVNRSGLEKQPITVLPLDKARTIVTGPFGLITANAMHVVFENIIWFDITKTPVLVQEGECAITLHKNEFHKCGRIVEQRPSTRRLLHPSLLVTDSFFRMCSAPRLMDLQADRNIFKVNTFERCAGEIFLQGNRSQIRYSYFLQQSEKPGIRVTSHGAFTQVLNCYFENYDGEAPLLGIHAAKSCVIAQNTFYHCRPRTIQLRDAVEESARMQCIVENNLFISKFPFSDSVIEVQTEPSRVTWGRNLIFPAGSSEAPPVVNANVPEDKWITADPKMVQENGIWKISAEGAAVDAGSNRASATITDIEGKIRSLRPDIGAHEISNEAVSTPQPTSVLKAR